MFGSSNKKSEDRFSTGDMETIIGRNTVFTGQLTGSGNVRVDGRIDGSIAVNANVVIGEYGVVNGDVSANSLLICGTINGNVTADEKLTIDSTGQLIGDIRVSQFHVSDGGIFQGRSEMALRVADSMI